MKLFNSSMVLAASMAALTVSTSLVAQVPQGEPTNYQRGAALRATEDGGYAIGSAYRATLSASGLEFTPALGANAPRTMPWQYQVQSVTRGGAQVRSAQTLSNGRVSIEGERFEVDHGQGMIERYDVLEQGVEQSFVFDKLPGRGDLVVRGTVTTEFEALPITDSNSVQFGFASYGGVHVKNVVGIDATGWRFPGSMSWDGTHLDLKLDAAFVDRATFPIVLDPLVGSSVGIGASGNDDRDPEVAFSSDLNRYLAVWTRYFSATDAEVRARLRTATNGSAGSFLVVTSGSNTLNLNPQVCSISGTDLFTVAWQAGPSVFGPFDIKAACINGSGTTGTINTLTSTPVGGGGTVATTESEIRPRLIGDPEGDEGNGVVVYEIPGTGIASRSFTPSMTLISRTPGHQVIVNDANATHAATSSGAAGKHALAYQTVQSGRDTVKIVRINQLGVPSSNTTSYYTAGSYPLRNPAVDGDGTNFRIVMEREWTSSDFDIVCANMSWNNAGTPSFNFSLANIATTGSHERNPRIGFLGQKYIVSWAERIGVFHYEAKVKAIGTTTNCPGCGQVYTLPGTRETELYTAIGTERSGDPSGDRALVLWTSADIAVPGISDVRGQLFEQFGGSSAVVVSPGCGAQTAVGGLGTFAIGSTDFELTAVTTVTTQQFVVFSFGVTGQTAPCGCTLIVPDVSIAMLMNNGYATYPLALPCNTALNGFTMDTQVAALNFAQTVGPCSLLPQMTFSSIKRWTLGF